jgi:hypothetical protein
MVAARSLPYKTMDIFDFREAAQIKSKMTEKIGEALGITSDKVDLITNFRSAKTMGSRLINQLNNKLKAIESKGVGGGVDYEDDINQILITNMKKFKHTEMPLLNDLTNIPGITKKMLSKMSMGFSDHSSAPIIARSNLANWKMFFSQYNPYKKVAQSIKQDTAKIMLYPFQFSQNKLKKEIFRILTGGEKPRPHPKFVAATGGYIENSKLISPKFDIPKSNTVVNPSQLGYNNSATHHYNVGGLVVNAAPGQSEREIASTVVSMLEAKNMQRAAMNGIGRTI